MRRYGAASGEPAVVAASEAHDSSKAGDVDGDGRSLSSESACHHRTRTGQLRGRLTGPALPDDRDSRQLAAGCDYTGRRNHIDRSQAPAGSARSRRTASAAYLCRSLASTSEVTVVEHGGSWARWSGRLWCVRAPGLISVRDPVFRAGDVMVDGVFPRGDALRPLGLWRPSTFGWRQQHAGSGPRGIGVKKGCARTDRRGQAGCRAWSPSSRRTWKLRLSSLRASARQARLPPSRSAACS
jgi:hypothetical protein